MLEGEEFLGDDHIEMNEISVCDGFCGHTPEDLGEKNEERE